MYRRITKSTPILVVAAILGYLCWPYVEDRTPRPKEVASAKALQSLMAVLAIPEAIGAQRDPFDSRAPSRSDKVQKGDAAAASSKPRESGPSPAGLTAAPSDLALQATHLYGDRRIALINGSVYSEGDRIKPSAPTGTEYTVARIYAHRVVLESESRTLELTYPLRESKPAAGASGKSRDVPGPAKAKTNLRKTS